MPTATDETTREFLARYYFSKKRRYLLDPDSAAEMVTGTPHDWEDARGYAVPVKREEG